jgi:hypothetical protein
VLAQMVTEVDAGLLPHGRREAAGHGPSRNRSGPCRRASTSRRMSSKRRGSAAGRTSNTNTPDIRTGGSNPRYRSSSGPGLGGHAAARAYLIAVVGPGSRAREPGAGCSTVRRWDSSGLPREREPRAGGGLIRARRGGPGGVGLDHGRGPLRPCGTARAGTVPGDAPARGAP